MSRIHRIYDHDFRQEAVNLLLSSGRPLKQVAKELGVTDRGKEKPSYREMLGSPRPKNPAAVY